MGSRLAKFSAFFSVGVLVGFLSCSRHFAWMSKVHSHEAQRRYAVLEQFADECEGMERTLSTHGIHIAHLTHMKRDDVQYPFVRFLPFPTPESSVGVEVQQQAVS